jgi:amidohydrolase
VARRLLTDSLCALCAHGRLLYSASSSGRWRRAGEIQLKYEYGYPPTVNAYPECVATVTAAAARVVGKEFAALPQRTMGAEDFSYFLQQRPGCFFFVGAALPGEPRPHHKSVFDFDERAMPIAASILVQLVVDLLCT